MYIDDDICSHLQLVLVIYGVDLMTKIARLMFRGFWTTCTLEELRGNLQIMDNASRSAKEKHNSQISMKISVKSIINGKALVIDK